MKHFFGRNTRILMTLSILMFFVPLLRAQNYAPYSLGVVGKAADVTADKNGGLHFIYVNNANELYYGRIINNQLRNQVKVATIAANEAYYGRPRIAVRNDGLTVHIVWGKTTLSHAWKDSGGTWRVETVRTAVTNHEYLMAVCAVTQDESVHVLYQYWYANAEASPMMYTRKPSGGAWTAPVNVGASANGEYRDPSVFVDAYGGFHASWRGLLVLPSAAYRYAPAGTGLENATTLFIPLASDVSHNAFGDLFVDENGRVHRPIATWTKRSSVGVDYSYKNLNGSFTTPTRPSVGDLVTKLDSNPSVAVAPTGHVFVSFRDFVGGNTVTYLSILNDGTWTKYVIDPSCGTTYNQHYKTSMTATAQGVYGLWRAANGTIMLGVGAVTPPSASVTVTSPNGMENWSSGSTRSIAWTTDDISGTVDLQLFRNFSLVGTIARDVPSSACSYAWTVGNYIGGVAANGQGYRVRVRTSDGEYQDLSNCAFTIGAAADPRVIVAVPNGGESLALGANHPITWLAANWEGGINIYLDRNGSPVGTIATGIAATAETYTWTVGNYQGGTALAGGGYAIRVETADAAAVDSSDGAFTLNVQTAPLALTAPSGGESWIYGSTQRITWTSSGVIGNLNLYLYKGTANLGLIASAVPVGNGGYNWKTGYLKNGTRVAVGSTYKVSIVSALNKKVSANGDAYMSIVKPKIMVASPVNGTVWKIGSAQRIKWTFTAVSGVVDIFLYKDGVLKGQIANDIPITDLGYAWTVGRLISGSAVKGTGYYILVKAVSTSVKGRSAGLFKLAL
jgi:hypothetical protein